MNTTPLYNSIQQCSNQNVGIFIDGVLHLSPFLPGPLSQIKSSLLGSTSDSNLNKYSTINKIPLITLNFSEANNEKKCPSPPSSEKTIIAPKVKDRTHNVTDKVTQVGLDTMLTYYCKILLPSYKFFDAFTQKILGISGSIHDFTVVLVFSL